MGGNDQDLMPAEFAGTGETPAQGDVPAVPAGAEQDEMHDWDVVSHTLWSIIPGVIIIVAVVLCMLEFLGLRGADANPVATGRKPQVLCIILLGSGGASAPLVKALLDLQHANGFRVVGDMLHNFATVFILCKVISQRSVAGLSWHSACLYALVFTTRYLDLATMWSIDIPEGLSIWDFVSVYNTVLKLLYLATTYGLLLMFLLFRSTYDADNDQFCKASVVLPALILAYHFAYYDEWVEILWTFSIFLEVVAMLPQLLLFRAFPCSQIYDCFACRCIPGGCPARSFCCPILPKPKAPTVPGAVAAMAGPATVDGLLWFYVLCMACYRACYLLNWVWRYHTQPNYWDPIVWVSGVCQTSLFMPFFYYYISRFMKTEQRYSALATDDLDIEKYGSTKEQSDNAKTAKVIVQHEREVLQKALGASAKP